MSEGRGPVTKVCVISGAASGIGRATLDRFAASGYSCIGIDRDRAAIDRLLGEIGDPLADRGRFVHADLVAAEEIELGLDAASDAAIELTLVNNVGGSSEPSGDALAPREWDRFADVLELNLKPLHTLTHACLGLMRANGYGRVVNVSSVSARRPLRTVDSAYAAAKAAVVALSRQLASELAGDGVLVNAVCPGVIATERIERRWATRDPEANREVLAEIPLGRLGSAEEVAEAIFFLGSTSTYTTGCVLDVNGGMYLA
jgi:NAD(P)-dependent dehydrogenase (short-subunit alcohol dehydrogenase family)